MRLSYPQYNAKIEAQNRRIYAHLKMHLNVHKVIISSHFLDVVF